MSFERPKLKAIIDRLDADIQSRLTVPQLRHSNAKVYGRVLAGAAHGLYGFVEYIKSRFRPSKCSSPLEQSCSRLTPCATLQQVLSDQTVLLMSRHWHRGIPATKKRTTS